MEGDNVYVRPNGKRNCRQCKHEADREFEKTRDRVAERRRRREKEREAHGYVPPSFAIDSGYVYKLTCLQTGEFYIGKTQKTVRQRWTTHCLSAESGSKKRIHQAIREYGKENFQIDVLDTANTSLDLTLSEAAWIANLKPSLNMTSGGLGVAGYKWSDEQRRKISEKAKARWANDEYRTKQTQRIKDGRDAFLEKLTEEQKRDLAQRRAAGNRAACAGGGGSKGAMRARTHCNHGHLFSDNEYFRRDGVRICRACMTISQQKQRAKKKAKTPK